MDEKSEQVILAPYVVADPLARQAGQAGQAGEAGQAGVVGRVTARL